jgi:hypothetical protein
LPFTALLLFINKFDFCLVKYLTKGTKKGLNLNMRKLCKTCDKRPVAVNYYKDGVAHYRKQCDHCSRARKEGTPSWYKAGYRKKSKCDRCAYTSKYAQQFNVFHIDGNLNNCRYDNLKSICANCQRLLHSLNLPWRQGDLTPDL